MDAIASMLASAVALAAMCAAFATMLGLRSLRDHASRTGLIAFALLALLPLASRVLSTVMGGALADARGASPLVLLGVIAGHVALGVFILRRRFLGDRSRQRADEAARARSRARQRIGAGNGEEREP